MSDQNGLKTILFGTAHIALFWAISETSRPRSFFFLINLQILLPTTDLVCWTCLILVQATLFQMGLRSDLVVCSSVIETALKVGLGTLSCWKLNFTGANQLRSGDGFLNYIGWRNWITYKHRNLICDLKKGSQLLLLRSNQGLTLKQEPMKLLGCFGREGLVYKICIYWTSLNTNIDTGVTAPGSLDRTSFPGSSLFITRRESSTRLPSCCFLLVLFCFQAQKALRRFDASTIQLDSRGFLALWRDICVLFFKDWMNFIRDLHEECMVSAQEHKTLKTFQT